MGHGMAREINPIKQKKKGSINAHRVITVPTPVARYVTAACWVRAPRDSRPLQRLRYGVTGEEMTETHRLDTGTTRATVGTLLGGLDWVSRSG